MRIDKMPGGSRQIPPGWTVLVNEAGPTIAIAGSRSRLMPAACATASGNGVSA